MTSDACLTQSLTKNNMHILIEVTAVYWLAGLDLIGQKKTSC